MKNSTNLLGMKHSILSKLRGGELVSFRTAVVLFFSGLLAFTSCEKSGSEVDGPSGPFLTTDVDTLQCTDATAKLSLEIQSNGDWELACEESWIVISGADKTGSGNKSITVLIKTNEDLDQRNAVITITGTGNGTVGLTKEVRVEQLGQAPSVLLSRQIIQFSSTADDYDLIVTANIPWTLDVPEDLTWVTVTQDENRATVRSYLKVTAENNEELEARSGTFDLCWTDPNTKQEDKVTVTVNQSPCVPTVTILGKNTINLTSYEAANDSTDVQIAGLWEVVLPAGAEEWITVDPAEGGTGSYRLYFDIAENNSEEPRTAEVAITSSGTETATVSISQGGRKPAISVSKDTCNFTISGQSKPVLVTSNFPWTATVSDDATSWLSVEPATGPVGADTPAKIVVTKNTAPTARTGKVTFSCSSDISTATYEVLVTQELYNGEDLSEFGSANCYIVNMPNTTYKFKATVMGNGKTDAEGKIRLYELNPTHAEELWRTTPEDPISDIRLEDGYIYFKTPETLIPSNVIIAAYSDAQVAQGKEEVLWSWHLWIDNYDEEAVTYPITYPHITPPFQVVFMNRNLGAMSDGELRTEEDVLKAYGFGYQWGRKDPFPNMTQLHVAPKGTGPTAPMYYGDGTIVPVEINPGILWENIKTLCETYPDQFTQNEYQCVEYAVAKPMTSLISADGTKEWTDENDPQPWQNRWTYTTLQQLRNTTWTNYLWGNPHGGDNSGDINLSANVVGTKTCYDPCPPGWRVPDRWAWSFISKTAQNQSNNNDVTTSTYNGSDIYVCDLTAGGKTDGTGDPNRGFQDWRWGFNVYTGGEGVGPTMFLPAAGCRTYGSTPRYTDWGESGNRASYWTNSTYSAPAIYNLASRLQMDAGLGNEVADEKKNNLNQSTYVYSSMFTSVTMSVRCIKDVTGAE